VKLDMGGGLGGLGGGGSSDKPLLTGESDGEHQGMHMDLGSMLGSLLGGESGGLGGAGSDAFTMDMVVDGQTMYIKAPFFAQLADMMPSGSSDPSANAFKELGDGWGKVDLTRMGDMAGSFNQSQMDPKKFLDMLKKTGKVKELGSDTIDGVKVNGLAAEVDLGELMKTQGVKSSQLGQAGDLAGVTFPLEAWVDGDGLIRRIKFTFDGDALAKAVEASGKSGGEDISQLGISMTMAMDFTDYGDDSIKVEIPSDAKDITEAFKAMSEASSTGTGSSTDSSDPSSILGT
jgi:hypothetical protein